MRDAVLALALLGYSTSAGAQDPDCRMDIPKPRGRVSRITEQLVTWFCDGKKLDTTRKTLRVITYHRNGRPARVVAYDRDAERPKLVTRTICRYNRRGDVTRQTVRDAKGVVEVDRWTYDRKGSVLKTTHWHERDQMGTSTVYKYDRKGRLLSQMTDHGPGNLDSGVKNRYEAGRLVESTRWIGQPRSTTRYEHDAKGRVVKATEVDRSKEILSRVTTRYTAAGREEVDLGYGNNGKLVSKKVQVFDSANRLTSRSLFGAAGKLTSKRVDTYDAKGRLTSTALAGPGGKLKHKHTIIFGPHGHAVEERRLGGDGSRLKLTCKRRYDRRGNWVGLVCCDKAWDEDVAPLSLPDQFRYEWACGELTPPDCSKSTDEEIPTNIVVLTRKIRYR